MTQPILTDDFYGTNADNHLVAVVAPTYGIGTLTLAGDNRAVITYSGGGYSQTTVYNTNMPVTVADIFVWTVIDPALIPAPQSGGNYWNICAGIAKDGNNAVMIEWGNHGSILYNGGDLVAWIGGGQSNISGYNHVPDTEYPSACGFALSGNMATMYLRFASGWTQVHAPIDLSGLYDFTAPGALTGWYACMALNTNSGPYTGGALRMGSGPANIPTLSAYEAQVITDGAASFVPGHETTAAALLDHITLSTNTWAGTYPAIANQTGAPAALGTTAVEFTSVNANGLQFPNPLNSPAVPQLTTEVWFKTTYTEPSTTLGLDSNSALLFSNLSGIAQTDWGLGITNQFKPSYGQGNPGTSIDNEVTALSNYNDGFWHHAVAVWNSTTGTATLYMDGAQVATSAAFDTAPTTGNTVWLCGLNTTGWDGLANNWAVYPIALDAATILNHYILGLVTGLCPNVVGLDLAAAETIITTDGLTVGTITNVVSTAPIGQVLTQSPAAGATVTAGEPVDLTVSEGFLVPDVTNTSATLVAPGIITGAGFVVGSVTHVPSVLVIPGNVISQSPAGGTYATGATPIDLVVSTGREGVFVPYITGDSGTDANTAITSIGLTVGAVSFAPSDTVPAGHVISQNPQGGTPVASGVLVSYVLSTGVPVVSSTFDVRRTVISQYANSPTLLQLVDSFAGYVEQSANFANFYSFVWNVDTAQGFGLDIWGRIVNVSRLLIIPTSARYVGFQDGTGPGVGTDVEPFSADGTWYVPGAGTEAYLLEDAPYRQLILTKALANIVNTTVPAFNKLLQNLFPGRGNPYVITSGVMAMEFHFDFTLTPIELAILEQSGAVPVPPGVSFTIVTP